MTWIVGGVISGYSEIGSVNAASVPASVIKIEMTDAKTGRLMKNREITGLCRHAKQLVECGECVTPANNLGYSGTWFCRLGRRCSIGWL